MKEKMAKVFIGAVVLPVFGIGFIALAGLCATLDAIFTDSDLMDGPMMKGLANLTDKTAVFDSIEQWYNKES